ncbi:isoflavone 7-O-methyltransferase-like [Prosopis cineraria]|uniref:isoflavone 7-O-methyltransferase-like n=1 Tax=Prosopis cineraria TaxID=364024 RepID=UPI002410AF2F|nr:isoflavone 7-O-methyltransferase-like [Prosopis cineraria]
MAYTLTPSSKFLVKGIEPNLTPMVLGSFHANFTASFDFLGRWFKGDEKTTTESAFGVGPWDMLGRDPQKLKSFNEAMASDSQMINMALRDSKSVFKGLESIVDVGGGTGSNNLSYVGGSMFESIPSADVVLLKWILHNWDDENAMKILNNCKEAISKKGGGKVIIIDAVIKEKEDEHEMTEVKLLFDIMMMSNFNGKERTEEEWKKLLVSAGFKHHKIAPLFGFRSIIEAYP